MAIEKSLLAILACPKCKGSLELENQPEAFGCKECNLLFKIEDDIPNFLIDEADIWKK